MHGVRPKYAEALLVWSRLTQQWLRCGALPIQLRQVRMVNLVKPHKLQANRQLADCGQMSVLSIFWRVFSSAWCSNTKDWLEEIGARAGAGSAEDLAPELLEQTCTPVELSMAPPDANAT